METRSSLTLALLLELIGYVMYPACPGFLLLH
jgi:hypothetical protein